MDAGVVCGSGLSAERLGMGMDMGIGIGLGVGIGFLRAGRWVSWCDESIASAPSSSARTLGAGGIDPAGHAPCDTC